MAVPPLMPLSDMLARILAGRDAVVPVGVPVAESVGLVAAQTVRAPRALPTAPEAWRRGIAVASAATVGASPFAPVLLNREPIAVTPGDPLPAGCDAVLPGDAVRSAGSLHELGQAAYPGEDAVLPGADLGDGAVIIRQGGVVTREAALALALAGIADIAVRRPLIAVRPPEPGTEAAGAWLAASLAAVGCRVVREGPAVLAIVIGRNAGAAGGGLGLNPGRDIGLTETPDGPVLVVPARFDAVVAAHYALLLPLVAALTGRRLRRRERPLTHKLASQIGLTDIALLRETEAGYEPLSVGRVTLAALCGADAVVLLDPASEGAAGGAPILAIPVREPLEPR